MNKCGQNLYLKYLDENLITTSRKGETKTWWKLYLFEIASIMN